MMTTTAMLVLIGAEMGMVASRHAKRAEANTAARLLFEGALQQTMSALENGTVSFPSNLDVNVDGQVTRVSMAKHASIPRMVTATATININGLTYQFTRNIGDALPAHPAYFALYSKKAFTMDHKLETGASEIDGDIYSDESITLKSNLSVINGDVGAKSGTSLGSATVTGRVSEVPAGVDFPKPKDPDYSANWTAFALDKSIINGSVFLSVLGRRPLIYVDGELTLRGVFNGTGVIFAKKKITINGDITYANASSKLIVISDGDIIVESGVTTLAGFFYTQKKFEWKNVGSNLLSLGGICADQVDLKGPTKVVHDRMFFEDPTLSAGYYLPGAWTP